MIVYPAKPKCLLFGPLQRKFVDPGNEIKESGSLNDLMEQSSLPSLDQLTTSGVFYVREVNFDMIRGRTVLGISSLQKSS